MCILLDMDGEYNIRGLFISILTSEGRKIQIQNKNT